MRIKVALPIILFAGLFLLLVHWFRPRPENTVAPQAILPPAPLAVTKPVVQTAAFPETLTRPVKAVPAAGVSETPETTLANADNANDQTMELAALAMNNDADSLRTILRWLTDPDRQIRDAALEATIQFDSPDAIPSLQDALAQTEDGQEKASIQKAIDFLKLQPLTQADTAD
jgi:hypothetical protein